MKCLSRVESKFQINAIEQRGLSMKIYVIEDEAVIRKELKLLLENALFETAEPADFRNVVDDILKVQPDLILLDVMLPEVSGFDLCTKIREKSEIPIIFLTSRTASSDELTGMLKGGDDYITKPYEPSILLAHISAVLKRARKAQKMETDFLTAHGATLLLSQCSIQYQGKIADLTRNELKILHILFQHSGEFVSRMDIMDTLWENHIFIDDNTLSVHVGRIREKLKEIGLDDLIETKRGIGYRV